MNYNISLVVSLSDFPPFSHNFIDFLFAPLKDEALKKESYFKGKNLLLEGANSFLYE